MEQGGGIEQQQEQVVAQERVGDQFPEPEVAQDVGGVETEEGPELPRGVRAVEDGRGVEDPIKHEHDLEGLHRPGLAEVATRSRVLLLVHR